MVDKNEGLTKIYNRFHDPNDDDADIRELRNLHQKMDKAVLDAYNWTNIQIRCDFFRFLTMSLKTNKARIKVKEVPLSVA